MSIWVVMYSQSYSDSESLDGSSLFLILWVNISLYLLASFFTFIFDIYEYVFINCDDTPRFEVFFVVQCPEWFICIVLLTLLSFLLAFRLLLTWCLIFQMLELKEIWKVLKNFLKAQLSGRMVLKSTQHLWFEELAFMNYGKLAGTIFFQYLQAHYHLPLKIFQVHVNLLFPSCLILRYKLGYSGACYLIP